MMIRCSVTLRPWDVIKVPVPFTDEDGEKERPALVLSERHFNDLGFVIVAMITRGRHEQWPSDVRIHELAPAGLRDPSVVRLVLFTLDAGRVLEHKGHLAPVDREAVFAALQETIVSSPA